jgi:hypothetical protein
MAGGLQRPPLGGAGGGARPVAGARPRLRLRPRPRPSHRSPCPPSARTRPGWPSPRPPPPCCGGCGPSSTTSGTTACG